MRGESGVYSRADVSGTNPECRYRSSSGNRQQPNEIAGALIFMMARSNTLQSEAGYIDASPHQPESTKNSCTARPDHT